MASSSFVRFKFILVSWISGLGFDIHWVWRHLLANLCTFVHLCALSGILGIFWFFGISRRCWMLLDVCSTFARRCSTLLDVCSTFARRCSTLLDVARCLLDVRFGFFAQTGTETPKQPKNNPKCQKMHEDSQKCTNLRASAPKPSEYPKQPGNSRKQIQKHQTSQTVRKNAPEVVLFDIAFFLTFHFWSIFSFWVLNFPFLILDHLFSMSEFRNFEFCFSIFDVRYSILDLIYVQVLMFNLQCLIEFCFSRVYLSMFDHWFCFFFLICDVLLLIFSLFCSYLVCDLCFFLSFDFWSSMFINLIVNVFYGFWFSVFDLQYLNCDFVKCLVFQIRFRNLINDFHFHFWCLISDLEFLAISVCLFGALQYWGFDLWILIVGLQVLDFWEPGGNSVA